MSKYIIVVDTICEGIQALERDEKDNIIVYATEEEAEAEVSKQRKEEPEAEFWSELFTSLVGWNSSVNQEKGE